MRDIVERLTFTADQFDAGFGGKSATTKLMREAADEIERLRMENAGLRAAMKDVIPIGLFTVEARAKMGY